MGSMRSWLFQLDLQGKEFNGISHLDLEREWGNGTIFTYEKCLESHSNQANGNLLQIEIPQVINSITFYEFTVLIDR